MRPTITTTLRASALVALLAAMPAHGQSAAGGTYASFPPSVKSVTCSDRCAALDAARVGSTVRVYGANLDTVAAVAFLGRRGTADDVLAKPSKVRSRTVYATVPESAATGPVQVVNADGTASNVGPELQIDRGPTRTAAAKTGAPSIDAKVENRKAFFDGTRPIALDYMVQGDQPTSVAVAVVRAADETPVMSWPARDVAPGSVQHLVWNGMVDDTGTSAPRGRYEFRVWTGATSGARAAQSTAPPTAVSSFLLIDNMFPVRGKHEFGESGASYGAARSGRTHVGQDVLADCGTPIAAVRGGVVKYTGVQGNAGNYIVINGAGTGVDFAYMHLRAPSPLRKGDRVKTGEQVGEVGRTGNATACLLHFEEWSAPGWYTGGKPFDPLPDLKAWDQYS